MGGKPEERLRCKEPFHSLEVELQREFGLTPIGSKALIRRIGEFLEEYVCVEPGGRSPGQVSYPAVAIGERAGKPIRHCLTVPVTLTVLHPSDAEVLHNDGSPALRRVRLARVCAEAYRQKAVLSHEDLSLLLGVDLSTVRRLVQLCAREGERPPTRGLIDDIGPVLSHKGQVVRLYFRGLLPERIAAWTGHSLGSVERYLCDFARVSELRRRGLSAEAMVRIITMSPALVRRYLELADELDRPEHAFVLGRLLRRFGPVTAPNEELEHG